MGSLKIVSADPDKALSLKVDALKSIFPLKQGDIFATDKIRKALENYKNAYGEYGFIDFTAEPDSTTSAASTSAVIPLPVTRSSAASCLSMKASSSINAPGR
jgi:outer membrane protein assembly factor BamA